MSEGNPTNKERLASIEANLGVLIKINSEDHKEMKVDFKELKKHVNEQSKATNKRLIQLENNQITSKTEWSMYKKFLLFVGGALALGSITLIFQFIAKLMGL